MPQNADKVLTDRQTNERMDGRTVGQFDFIMPQILFGGIKIYILTERLGALSLLHKMPTTTSTNYFNRQQWHLQTHGHVSNIYWQSCINLNIMSYYSRISISRTRISRNSATLEASI